MNINDITIVMYIMIEHYMCIEQYNTCKDTSIYISEISTHILPPVQLRIFDLINGTLQKKQISVHRIGVRVLI